MVCSSLVTLFVYCLATRNLSKDAHLCTEAQLCLAVNVDGRSLEGPAALPRPSLEDMTSIGVLTHLGPARVG